MKITIQKLIGENIYRILWHVSPGVWVEMARFPCVDPNPETIRTMAVGVMARAAATAIVHTREFYSTAEMADIIPRVLAKETL